MFSKLVALCTLFAVSIAQHHAEYSHQPVEHSAPAHYEFSYSVHDEHTGDIKSQQESRHGDAVHGRYELIDSDGYKRIVEYTADKHTGFNAVVHREPTNIKIPVPAPKVQQHYAAPSHYSAPAKVSQYISAPISYTSAPVHSHVSAPIVKATKKIVPVQEYISAPVTKYAPIHVAKYSAPSHSTIDSAHVTFSAPDVNYHY